MIDRQHFANEEDRSSGDAVLLVAPYLPLPADFGGAIRILELTKRIASRQPLILLAPSSDPARDYALIKELGQICDVTVVPASQTAREPASRRKRLAQIQASFSAKSTLERTSFLPQMQSTMDRLFMTRAIGLVQYDFPQSTFYRPLRPVPAVFDAHNVEHDLLRRIGLAADSLGHAAFNLLEWRKLRRLEHQAWNAVDLCVATSEGDAGRIKLVTGQDVPVVPNGVNLRENGLRDPKQDSDPPILVFVGAMRHQPNADGAIWFANEVFPRIQRQVPDVQLRIVGADPPPPVRGLERPGILITGKVASVEAHLREATVAIVPLHSGGGTRIKILEAFASGTPVVSTTIGAEGIAGISGQHFLLADNAEEFSAATIDLLGDPPRQRQMADEALRLVSSNYTWDIAGDALLKAHSTARERFRARQ